MLSEAETLAQVINLIEDGHDAAAVALLDGSGMDASVLVLDAAPELFAQYADRRDWARLETCYRLARSARLMLDEAAR